jgi:hypothetical protein
MPFPNTKFPQTLPAPSSKVPAPPGTPKFKNQNPIAVAREAGLLPTAPPNVDHGAEARRYTEIELQNHNNKLQTIADSQEYHRRCSEARAARVASDEAGIRRVMDRVSKG